ncbi:MAG TPA: ROK family protein [Cyclobacteriaceae bacterium]|nr:ROK family protein [Cyclobacteriaceae bacterium]
MSILGIDLGGTKLASAIFTESGEIKAKEAIPLSSRSGPAVGELIAGQVRKYLSSEKFELKSIGISVPGISHHKTGTVWAPNIPGWNDYPLLHEIKMVADEIPVSIDSDRACSMLGEIWQGKAKGSRDAIFLAVGTGIGAGILIDGHILRGSQDIAGAVGWMALQKPFQQKYLECGCFEYYASGEGIAKLARETLIKNEDYRGRLRNQDPSTITAHTIFQAHKERDEIAVAVIRECIEFWGMATANLISIFNPEKIIFGGGIFGPGEQFIPAIRQEAKKWAQPISMKQVSFEKSTLHGDAAVYGAAFLAIQKIREN